MDEDDALDVDEDQRQCVESEAPHVLMCCGPGSGKTRTVAALCRHLIEERGLEPSSLIVVTFTNKAASELRERISHEGVRVGTYHALALITLRTHGVGMFDGDFTILTSSTEATRVFREFLRTQGGAAWAAHASAVTSHYAAHKLRPPSIPTALTDGSGGVVIPASVVADAFAHFEAHKLEHSYVEFDDLLHSWRSFLLSDTESARAELASVRYVILDEVQDSNELQTDIARTFALKGGASIVAVGDDCQSIYGFRGGCMHAVLEFVTTLPGAERMALCKNYRSTPQICGIGDDIIQFNSRRLPKPMMQSMCADGPVPALYAWDSEEEEREFVASVCERALRHHEECAVLVRTNREVDTLHTLFTKRRIQHALLKSNSLLDRAHVKLLLSLYRFVFLQKPSRDDVLFLLTSHRAVTRTRAESLYDLLTKPPSVAHALVALDPFMLPNGLRPLREALEPFVRPLADVHAGSESAYESYNMQIATVCTRHLETIMPLVPDDQLDIVSVERARARHVSFASFLDAVYLGSLDVDNGANSTRLISLGTIHQAKGLEFDSVVIMGCSDGSIPNGGSCGTLDEVEEERRLLYVAATRARTQLCFSFARQVGAKSRRLTQFLRPLVTHLLIRRDPGVVEVSSGDDVSQFMRKYGRFNLLGSAAASAVKWEKYEGQALSPCPLLPPRARETSMFTPGHLTTVFFRRMFLTMFEQPSAEWKDVVHEVCVSVFGEVDGYTRERALRGRVADGCMSRTAWSEFMDETQGVVDRLLAPDPTVVTVHRGATLQLDHCLFYVDYRASTPDVSVTLDLLCQAAQCVVPVRTLVCLNLYTGSIHRAAYTSTVKTALASSLPLIMKNEPLVQRLLL